LGAGPGEKEFLVRQFVLGVVASLPLLAAAQSLDRGVQERFDIAATVPHTTPDARAMAIRSVYEAYVAPAVHGADSLSAPELHALLDMAWVAGFYARAADYDHRRYYLNDVIYLTELLVRRHQAEPIELEQAYQRLLEARLFTEAATWHQRFPAVATGPTVPPPKVGQVDTKRPAGYAIKDGRLALEQVDLPGDAYVVIHAGCHFSHDAAKAIKANPSLMEVFRTRAVVWVVDDSEPLETEALEDWNKEFPDFPLRIVYNNAAWPGVDFTAIPTFNYFVHGKHVGTDTGWSAKTTETDLAAAFHRMGLLPAKPGKD
jgi:hypothetical protein